MNAKKAISWMLAGVMILSLTACSQKGNSADPAEDTGTAAPVVVEYSRGLDEHGFYEGIKANEVVQLPEDFATITLRESQLQVSDAEVEDYLDYLAEGFGTHVDIENHAVEDGDYVTIDFIGTVDGKEFEEGCAKDYALHIGSGAMIEGFEDQIIGHTPGEEFDITVTFPEGYGTIDGDADGNAAIDLSGRETVFHITLKSIYDMRLTDADIVEAFGEDTLTADGQKVTTVDGAKEYYRQTQYDKNRKIAISEYLVQNSTFDAEVLNTLIADRSEVEKQYVINLATEYGFTDLSEFLSIYGITDLDSYIESHKSDIEAAAKYCLAMQAVAEKLSIEMTAQDIIELYGSEEAANEILEHYTKGYVYQRGLHAKVEDILAANAIHIEE